MAKNEYFKKALSDFAFDMAGGGAIRHLADKGYTVNQILKELHFAVPVEKVRQTVWDRLKEQQILLLHEPGINTVQGKAVFVEERTKFGKTSFRRVVIPGEDAKQIRWKKIIYTAGQDRDLRTLLSVKCLENKWKPAYMSCDFGVLEREDVRRYQKLLELLDERQREYVEGLPWICQRVYHRMDSRMTEIAGRLSLEEGYKADFYFMELEEKIIVGM